MIPPSFDKFNHTVFDPMHSMLEGILALYFWVILVLGGKWGDADKEVKDMLEASFGLEELIIGAQSEIQGEKHESSQVSCLQVGPTTKPSNQALKRKTRKESPVPLGEKELEYLDMLIQRKVVAPSSVGSLPRGWGTESSGTPKAADWRAFVSCYGALTMPARFEKFGCLPDGTPGENQFLSREERNCFMSLLEIIDLGMRSSISNVQLDHLDGLINNFVRDLNIRHPEVTANTNLHTLTHFTRDVRQATAGGLSLWKGST